MVLQRNGQFFAGQLSGGFTPVPLQELDIILLSFLMVAHQPEIAAQKFIDNPIVKSMVSGISVQIIVQRLDDFINKGLLIKDDAPYAEQDTLQPEEPASGTKQLIKQNTRIRLTSNFALIPSVQGFKIWSPLQRGYILLSTELLLVLTLFAKTDSFSSLVTQTINTLSPEKAEKLSEHLLTIGVLFAEADDEEKKPALPCSEVIERSPNGMEPDISVVRWEDINADGRIPVYFVPHMQNHYPLALGMIYSSLQAHGDGELLKDYLLIPINYLSPEAFINGPYKKFGKGVWLFSNYMWSLDTNLKISALIKSHLTGNLTIHGGPSTPDYELKSRQFFEQHDSVDICVHGEGEAAIVEIFKCLSRSQNKDISYLTEKLECVAGISFRNHSVKGDHLIRTKSRTRLEKLDMIPSPYNQGYFDSYSDKVEAAIIESNRGCPFGCTFCDWGSATNQKIRKFDLERTKQEIDWIAKQKVRVLWIADANFGLYDRDIELSEFIVETKEKYGYPQEIVVNYTKNTTWRLAEIIKVFSAGGIISQGVISIQTTDTTTLEVINRKNIKTKKYDELSEIFRNLSLPLSTDLMIGLPGITLDAFKKDLQRYFDLDVSLKAYPTQLLPNSPMADPEYIEKYKIKVDQDDFLISTYSYSEDDLKEMKLMYQIYTVADGYSLLRYVLRFLQWDHNIKATTVLDEIRKIVHEGDKAYPRIVFAFRFFETDKCMPGGWSCFYDEIAHLVYSLYGVDRDSALDTVLKLNEMAMPEETRSYPVTLKVEHDFERYFLARNSKQSDDRLQDYTASAIEFDDPDGMSNINSRYIQYDSHQFFWEVRSNIARAKSASDVI